MSDNVRVMYLPARYGIWAIPRRLWRGRAVRQSISLPDLHGNREMREHASRMEECHTGLSQGEKGGGRRWHGEVFLF